MAIYDKNGNVLTNDGDLSAFEGLYESLGEAIAENNKLFASSAFKRIVFIDNNYKYFSVANIKLIIDQMHTSGLNYLMLGFGGSGKGLSFKLSNMTIEANDTTYDLTSCVHTDFGHYLTEADMSEIITYAKTNGVDIIPLLTVPSHFTAFLVDQPQFRWSTSTSSLDIDNEKAVNYGLAVCELYIKWFASKGIKFWNFGADEFGVNTQDDYYNLHQAGNYNYAKFINKIAFLATKYRMVPMAWNHPLCTNSDSVPFINRQIEALYWAQNRTNWATATRLESEGYKLINSDWKYLYWVANGDQVTEAKIRTFNIHNFVDGSTIANPIGCCFCVWIGDRESPALDDGGSAITTAVLPLIAAYGETIASQIN